MSIYYHLVINKYPLYIGDLKLANKNYKLGDPLPDGWAEVKEMQKPEIPLDQVGKKRIVELYPKNINGSWCQQFEVQDAVVTIEEAQEFSKQNQKMYLQHLQLVNPGWVPPTE